MVVKLEASQHLKGQFWVGDPGLPKTRCWVGIPQHLQP